MKYTKASIVNSLCNHFSKAEVARLTSMSEAYVKKLCDEFTQEQKIEHALASLAEEDSDELRTYQEEQAAKAKEFVDFKNYVAELYKKFEGKR